MEGFSEREIRKEDVKPDKEKDGVWIGSEVFLPRNVVIWAVQALASEKKA